MTKDESYTKPKKLAAGALLDKNTAEQRFDLYKYTNVRGLTREI